MRINESINDLNSKYSQTMCVLRPDDSIFYVSEFPSTSEVYGRKVIDAPEGKHKWGNPITIPLSRLTDMDYSFPRPGYINQEKIPSVYFSRAASRQWRKGVHRKSVSLTRNSQASFHPTCELASQRLDQGNLRNYYDVHVQPDLVYHIFNRAYPSYEEAYEKLKAMNSTEIAFDYDWCICMAANHVVPMLFYKTTLVGLCFDGLLGLDPKAAELYEDLKETVGDVDVEIIA